MSEWEDFGGRRGWSAIGLVLISPTIVGSSPTAPPGRPAWPEVRPALRGGRLANHGARDRLVLEGTLRTAPVFCPHRRGGDRLMRVHAYAPRRRRDPPPDPGGRRDLRSVAHACGLSGRVRGGSFGGAFGRVHHGFDQFLWLRDRVRLETNSAWPTIVLHTSWNSVWNSVIQSSFNEATTGTAAPVWVGESGILTAPALLTRHLRLLARALDGPPQTRSCSPYRLEAVSPEPTQNLERRQCVSLESRRPCKLRIRSAFETSALRVVASHEPAGARTIQKLGLRTYTYSVHGPMTAAWSGRNFRRRL